MGPFAFAQFASLITERMLSDPRWWFSSRTKKIKAQRLRLRAAQLFGRGGYMSTTDLCESANLLALLGPQSDQEVTHFQMANVVRSIAEDLWTYAGGVNAREYCEVMADHKISNLGRVYTRLLLHELKLLRTEPPPDPDVQQGFMEEELEVAATDELRPLPLWTKEEEIIYSSTEVNLDLAAAPLEAVNEAFIDEPSNITVHDEETVYSSEKNVEDISNPVVIPSNSEEEIHQTELHLSSQHNSQEAADKQDATDTSSLVVEEPVFLTRLKTSLESFWSSMWPLGETTTSDPIGETTTSDRVHKSMAEELSKQGPSDGIHESRKVELSDPRRDVEEIVDPVTPNWEELEDETVCQEEQKASSSTSPGDVDSGVSEELNTSLNTSRIWSEEPEGFFTCRPPDSNETKKVKRNESLAFFEEAIRCRVDFSLEIEEESGGVVRWTDNWICSAEKRPTIFITFCTYGDHDRFGHAEVAAATRLYEDIFARLSLEQQADVNSAPVSGSAHFHV